MTVRGEESGDNPLTLSDLYSRTREVISDIQKKGQVLPEKTALQRARKSLKECLPIQGLGFNDTSDHLLQDVVPALNASSLSPNYYGFVVGGATPAAEFADNIVTAFDQNVQVHLPNETVATSLEDTTLRLLLELFGLSPAIWTGRTFTTGATSSNVLGLACGREHASGGSSKSIAEVGLIEACSSGLRKVQILTTRPHSSLSKAASIIGMGRLSVKTVGQVDDPLKFDTDQLVSSLQAGHEGTINIVVISCGEVNTGRFATNGLREFQQIRDLCDRYKAWMHVDGAFGMFSRILDPSEEFERARNGSMGIELADSITGDAHKLLNVKPYDCGFFFSRHPKVAQQVFMNPNAAYLSSRNTEPSTILSPLNIGIENSRRFRALPVYATLIAYSRVGYQDMLKTQIRLARGVASYIWEHQDYELLPDKQESKDVALKNTYIVVLFRAKDNAINKELVKKINGTSKIYVSETSWDGRPACRIAVSNWRADEARDVKIIADVLESVFSGAGAQEPGPELDI
ncbi:MAG: hypothetical protein M1827_006016 [Pycnora praestabilis]|nr:MAG: hypothetical protein M1827_006016 [Pycnora praestabilis]